MQCRVANEKSEQQSEVSRYREPSSRSHFIQSVQEKFCEKTEDRSIHGTRCPRRSAPPSHLGGILSKVVGPVHLHYHMSRYRQGHRLRLL